MCLRRTTPVLMRGSKKSKACNPEIISKSQKLFLAIFEDDLLERFIYMSLDRARCRFVAMAGQPIMGPALHVGFCSPTFRSFRIRRHGTPRFTLVGYCRCMGSPVGCVRCPRLCAPWPVDHESYAEPRPRCQAICRSGPRSDMISFNQVFVVCSVLSKTSRPVALMVDLLAFIASLT